MQTESYRSRAKQVRQSARSHLVALRKARMAKRPISAPAILEPDPVIEESSVGDSFLEEALPATEQEQDPPEFAADVGPDELDDIALRNAAMAEMAEPGATDPQLPSEVQRAEEPSDSHVQIDDSLDTLESDFEPIKDAESDDMLEASECDTKEPVGDAGQDIPSDSTTEDTHADWANSELTLIPGAGPGLIWMLEQCGVRDLTDLAAQEEEDLSLKLGVVGQVLDVGKWIESARAKVAS